MGTVAPSNTNSKNACLECTAPGNISKTGETSNSISFSWDAVSGVYEYVLIYELVGQIISDPIEVSGTSYTFTGLSSGTYTFYFSSKCGGITSTSWIIIDDIDS